MGWEGSRGKKALGFFHMTSDHGSFFSNGPSRMGGVRSWAGFARCQWVSCGGTVGTMEVWPGSSLCIASLTSLGVPDGICFL